MHFGLESLGYAGVFLDACCMLVMKMRLYQKLCFVHRVHSGNVSVLNSFSLVHDFFTVFVDRPRRFDWKIGGGGDSGGDPCVCVFVQTIPYRR